ncbi:hypothetical protein AgCh_028386 [Apium graveolens]
MSPKFYGPFKVLNKVGQVAYAIDLPSDCRIHNVFHISMLKAFHDEPPLTPPLLPHLFDGKVVPQPFDVLRSRNNRGTGSHNFGQGGRQLLLADGCFWWWLLAAGAVGGLLVAVYSVGD